LGESSEGGVGVDGDWDDEGTRVSGRRKEKKTMSNSQKRNSVPMETKRSVDQNVSSAGGADVELGGPRGLGAEEAATEEMT